MTTTTKGLLTAILAATVVAPMGGCDSCRDAPAVVATHDATVEPTPPFELVTDVMVGGRLANATSIDDKGDGKLAAVLRGTSRLVVVEATGAVGETNLGSSALGGITALPSGEVMVLEADGDRVFKVAPSSGAEGSKVVGELQVGDGPRVMALGPPDSGRAWVVTRTGDEPLVEIDWRSMALVGRAKAGEIAADIVLEDDDKHLAVADLGGGRVLKIPLDGGDTIAVDVADKPYLLVPSADQPTAQLYVLHSNSPVLTRVEGNRVAASVKLDFVPGALVVGDGAAYVLAPGSGILAWIDLETLVVRGTQDVPTGSLDLLYSKTTLGPRLMVSTADAGKVVIYDPSAASGGLRDVANVPVGDVAGRLHPGIGDHFWALAPTTGRVMRVGQR